MRLDAACDLYNDTLRDLYRGWAGQEYPSGEHAAVAGPVDNACVVDRTCMSPAVVDDVVHRAEQAFGAFVLRHQHTGAPRPPAFRARQHFVSITFPDWSSGTRGGLELPGVGAVAVNKFRALPTRSMPVTVKHQGHIWQACFSIRA
jgi:hypothetical protein